MQAINATWMQTRLSGVVAGAEQCFWSSHRSCGSRGSSCHQQTPITLPTPLCQLSGPCQCSHACQLCQSSFTSAASASVSASVSTSASASASLPVPSAIHGVISEWKCPSYRAFNCNSAFSSSCSSSHKGIANRPHTEHCEARDATVPKYLIW